MRKDLIPDQEDFNKMTRQQQAECLCTVHECDGKRKTSHIKAYLEGWNCHPPARFVKWWTHEGVAYTEKKTDRGWRGVNPVTAFNCQAARDAYREAKEVGLI